jgi:AcrR family transcriptional regulator
MGTALAERTQAADRPVVDDGGTSGPEPGLVTPDRAGSPRPADSPRSADSRARVLEAALRCVARFGISKTTVEDIAREARLSRASLYRFFPGGREEIVVTMVEREVGGYFRKLGARLDGVEDYEERIVIVMTAAAEQLVAHEALGFVLAHEPERVLPHVSFTGLDHVLDTAAAFFAPYLVGLLEPEDARRAAEWVTRLVLSHLICPPGSIPVSWSERRTSTSSLRGAAGTPFALHPEPLTEDRARWLVSRFVMPGIRALTAASNSAVT